MSFEDMNAKTAPFAVPVVTTKGTSVRNGPLVIMTSKRAPKSPFLLRKRNK